MVKAVQAGRKTQTRRPMYPQPDRVIDGRFYRADGREIICPFGAPGDRLWVRERFAELEDGTILFAADPIKGRSKFIWQQSRYLPREKSRLTLRVLSTRPQQLQDISESDARAEGYDVDRESLSPIDWFARLWDRLSVVESLRWAANPWLWVVHFKLATTDLIQQPQSPIAVQEPPTPLPPASVAIPSRARSVRSATFEEKHQLAQMLRSRSI